jgi:hypothetical protein
MHPQNLRVMEENKKHTLFRSVSLNPRDISLFRSSRINSITVFGSMKAVEDMSAKRSNRCQTGNLRLQRIKYIGSNLKNRLARKIKLINKKQHKTCSAFQVRNYPITRNIASSYQCSETGPSVLGGYFGKIHASFQVHPLKAVVCQDLGSRKIVPQENT